MRALPETTRPQEMFGLFSVDFSVFVPGLLQISRTTFPESVSKQQQTSACKSLEKGLTRA